MRMLYCPPRSPERASKRFPGGTMRSFRFALLLRTINLPLCSALDMLWDFWDTPSPGYC